MWRKTRTTVVNPFCPGADPNRNWDAEWGSKYHGRILTGTQTPGGEVITWDGSKQELGRWVGKLGIKC